MVGAIVVAAGSSTRMNGINKITVKLKNIPVIIRTLMNFEVCDLVDFVVVVTREDMIFEIEEYIKEYELKKVKKVISGGNTRQESVEKGLIEFPKNTDIVLIHDGARPFISPKIIEDTVNMAKEHNGAIVAVPVKDTIKVISENRVEKTIDRSKLYNVQTPQAFNYSMYKKAQSIAKENNLSFTDDSQLFENIGKEVVLVNGDYKNIKITTTHDLNIANSFLEEDMYRIGHGYDVHKLVENRKLILGGVDIPYSLGLLGHSDADVLSHAIMDAILGALAKGDIGKLFPDNDEEFKGISSLVLLKRVTNLMKNEGFFINNIDATIVLQEPKLRPYIDEMRKNIATSCDTQVERVNIKATTEEGLGFSGTKEGAAAHTVVMLQKFNIKCR